MSDPLSALRIVVAWSDRRNLCSLVADQLRSMAGESETRAFGEEAYVVHTALSAAELRDRLRHLLLEGDSLFVADFEVWSGHGAGVDAKWLLSRGH
jgi:hypothetical protein